MKNAVEKICLKEGLESRYLAQLMLKVLKY